MGKYLTNFKTKEEYEAFKAGGSYLTPNVSFIETAGSVINDSYQVQGGSASTVEYFDVRGLAEDIKLQLIISAAILLKIEGGMIMTSGIMIELGGADTVDAMAIIPSMPVKMPGMDNVITIGELIAEYSGSLPRITEEEFYNLDNGGE